MSDLHAHFRALDDLRPPDLWTQIEARAVATRRQPEVAPLVVLAAGIVLVLAIVGGAVYDRSPGAGHPGPAVPTNAETPSPTPGQRAAGVWMAAGNTPFNGSTVLLADGRILVAGVSDAALYDPGTGAWTATGSMIEARGGNSATLLADGRVLVAGGQSRDSAGAIGPYVASAELYDPRTGTWTATGSMLETRADHAAILLPDGRVLVAGGDRANGVGVELASAELYDPDTGAWTATGSMTEARRGNTAALLPDGTVLVTGGVRRAGYSWVDLASAELYDPATGSWAATQPMRQAGIGRTATLLPDGTVLVAGSGGMVMYAAAELYHPGTGTWTTTGNMVERRGYHSATLLLDGRVLLAGGANGTGDHHITSTAELYDPNTGAWTQTASLAAPRKFHTAVLLSDGTVLVLGGTDGATNTGWHRAATAEIFIPSE